MRYCIWNNKGGVGKSFLSFCLATEYAITHKDEIVVVADLCPQSNVSEMLLGGNGDGQKNQLQLSDSDRTIAGYIKDRYKNSRLEKLGTETNYFVNVSKYNKRIPENLFLLTGDLELDLVSVLVSSMAKEPLKEAPVRTMSLLKDILNAYENSVKNKRFVFFIDCNPSFAIYTELAIFASDRLIIPCTGDFASLRGANNVVKILFNIGDASKESIFNIENFNEKASRLKLNIPVPYLGIINKARTRNKEATIAYKAHVEAIESFFSGLEVLKDSMGSTVFGSSVRTVSIKDCNNISLVVNHSGIPVSKLENKRYVVYGRETQVNQSQVNAMVENMVSVLDLL